MGSYNNNYNFDNFAKRGENSYCKICRKFIFPSYSKGRKFYDLLHLINMIYIAIAVPL